VLGNMANGTRKRRALLVIKRQHCNFWEDVRYMKKRDERLNVKIVENKNK
jgi:hypothetical protein